MHYNSPILKARFKGRKLEGVKSNKLNISSHQCKSVLLFAGMVKSRCVQLTDSKEGNCDGQRCFNVFEANSEAVTGQQ